ncbi:hypothetical protein L2E82_29623 [Cichorium intybus]|uniref:Uncharacterized protein n=1 Tax=Cichorium intybus TaxID=13427 RepID=A0ACB9CY26_CICIN|nr:hypothetical protein L2E82_29623 [Cichorium intybus]
MRILKSRCIMSLEYSAHIMEVEKCQIVLHIETWGHQYHLPSHHLLASSRDSISAVYFRMKGLLMKMMIFCIFR